MIVSGADASTYAAKSGYLASSRLIEVINTPVPAGTITDAADAAGRISMLG